MAVLSLFPTLISFTPRHHLLLSLRRVGLSSPRCAVHSENGRRVSRKEVLGCRATKDNLDGGSFVDDDGGVKDMDAYLNYLSLEYESVWDTKPSWCQPWTILLTGVSVIAVSWLVAHSMVFSASVTCFICTWWYIFLYSYPKAKYIDLTRERK